MSEYDFLEAARKGRQAAVDADASLKEIRGVVGDLDAQIRQLSNGQVGVLEGTWPPPPKNYMPPMKATSPQPTSRR